MKQENSYKTQFFSHISSLIREARVARGMKQEVLASKLNITRTSLINIEKGRQHPNLFLIFEVAYHLGIKIDQLLPSMEDFNNNYLNLEDQITVETIQVKGDLSEVKDDIIEFLKKLNNEKNESANN